ncbi:pirin family protein [Burkholderia ubonensis]|uniref:Pirin n=1 Tax=Burkholderia ubonensis TaxID=101571 RepID=A0A107F6Q2_9BURK|nr:pirin family protein [Burkholderia ubonensis]KWD82808.1 pirin [Burkholderia ubonensis]KWD88010.1 pirin [Burkholderia ubonensis]KWD98537.1 pirin [Burkholderia ubonensis]KWE11780.1 pirin [Burkholderia ubonensis]
MDTRIETPSASSEPGPQAAERYPARAAEVGALPIHRALPNRQRKTVGAWCFLDHAGPVALSGDTGMHVGPHPHIGLQTFTWMIEGSVLHRDSLGYEQVIRPGEVNLMTAGRGIAHTEDTEDTLLPGGRFHAVQLWIALPDAHRDRAPAFENYRNLPVHRDGGFTITVLAGAAFDRVSPAQVYSPLVGLDFASDGPARLAMPLDPAFEYAVFALTGDVAVDGAALEPNVLLYLGTGRDRLELTTEAAARFIVLGGAPFEEDLLIWWNFVARSPAEMAAAADAWNAQRGFGDVQGETAPRMEAPALPPAWK